MNDYKAAVTRLRQSITEAKIELDFDPYSGALTRTQQQLTDVEFETSSPCRNITVHMGADRKIKDISFHEKALERLSYHEMGNRLTQTIRRAEQIATEGLKSALQRSGA